MSDETRSAFKLLGMNDADSDPTGCLKRRSSFRALVRETISMKRKEKRCCDLFACGWRGYCNGWRSATQTQEKTSNMRPTPLAAKAVSNQKLPNHQKMPGQKVAPAQQGSAAAAKLASERGRMNARNYRSMPGSVDSIREKVRREMKAEAAVSKAHAKEKLEIIDAQRAKEDEAKLAMRQEARRAYSQALAEEVVLATAEEAAPASADNEPSHVERITLLLKERSERMRADRTESATESLRQRAAARRLDSDRFGAAAPVPRSSRAAPTSEFIPASAAAASAPLVGSEAPTLEEATTSAKDKVETVAAAPMPNPTQTANGAMAPEAIKRSLFEWKPPEPAEPTSAARSAGAAALSGAQASAAARDAWAWLQRPASHHSLHEAPEDDAEGSTD